MNEEKKVLNDEELENANGGIVGAPSAITAMQGKTPGVQISDTIASYSTGGQVVFNVTPIALDEDSKS